MDETFEPTEPTIEETAPIEEPIRIEEAPPGGAPPKMDTGPSLIEMFGNIALHRKTEASIIGEDGGVTHCDVQLTDFDGHPVLPSEVSLRLMRFDPYFIASEKVAHLMPAKVLGQMEGMLKTLLATN